MNVVTSLFLCLHRLVLVGRGCYVNNMSVFCYTGEDMSETAASSSSEILDIASRAESSLVPKKSREAYEKEYKKFWDWMASKNGETADERVC